MAPRKKARDPQFLELGVQGRKTGITLEEGERDEFGIENIDGLFSSPAKPSPRKPSPEKEKRKTREASSVRAPAPVQAPPPKSSPAKSVQTVHNEAPLQALNEHDDTGITDGGIDLVENVVAEPAQPVPEAQVRRNEVSTRPSRARPLAETNLQSPAKRKPAVASALLAEDHNLPAVPMATAPVKRKLDFSDRPAAHHDLRSPPPALDTRRQKKPRADAEQSPQPEDTHSKKMGVDASRPISPAKKKKRGLLQSQRAERAEVKMSISEKYSPTRRNKPRAISPEPVDLPRRNILGVSLYNGDDPSGGEDYGADHEEYQVAYEEEIDYEVASRGERGRPPKAPSVPVSADTSPAWKRGIGTSRMHPLEPGYYEDSRGGPSMYGGRRGPGRPKRTLVEDLDNVRERYEDVSLRNDRGPGRPKGRRAEEYPEVPGDYAVSSPKRQRVQYRYDEAGYDNLYEARAAPETRRPGRPRKLLASGYADAVEDAREPTQSRPAKRHRAYEDEPNGIHEHDDHSRRPAQREGLVAARSKRDRVASYDDPEGGPSRQDALRSRTPEHLAEDADPYDDPEPAPSPTRQDAPRSKPSKSRAAAAAPDPEPYQAGSAPPPEHPPKRKRGRPPGAKNKPKPGSDHDVVLEPWEQNAGIINARVQQYDPDEVLEPDEQQLLMDIAYGAPALQTREVPNSSFRYAKMLTLPFFGCGIVDLPPGGVKRTKNARRMQMVFFVHAGKVLVEMAGNRFRISKGGMWHVPRGNFYSISNDHDKPARIFFAQGAEVAMMGTVFGDAND